MSRNSSSEIAPDTPQLKQNKRRVFNYLFELPEELLEKIVALHTEPKDLCALAQACTKLQALVEVNARMSQPWIF